MIDFIVRRNPRVTTPFLIYFYTSDLNTLIRLLLKLVLTERGQWEPYSNQNGELCNHITFENNEGKLYAVSGLIMFTEHTESSVQVERDPIVFQPRDFSLFFSILWKSDPTTAFYMWVCMSKWPWPFNAAIGFIGKYSVHNFTLVLQLAYFYFHQKERGQAWHLSDNAGVTGSFVDFHH